ncbi:MAG: flavodoxin [Planctomycetota bacterium]|jgi:flavodoxin|nr:flavodoxin [Planctomycetota bacterium]
MKNFFFSALALLYVTTAAAATVDHAQNQPARKILVAYFSWGGNTRTLAQEIHRRTGGDLFEIKTVQSYPAEYASTVEVAKREKEANARPALSTHVRDMASYDTVLIGYPIWHRTIPMAVAAFLEEYDFSGRLIVPFCSYGRGLRGSGLGDSVDDIKKRVPGANVGEALEVFHWRVGGSQSEIGAWLRQARIGA